MCWLLSWQISVAFGYGAAFPVTAGYKRAREGGDGRSFAPRYRGGVNRSLEFQIFRTRVFAGI